jgi:prolipoprotein diacylglyceryltransferase
LSASAAADPALLRFGALELRWSGVLLGLGLALGYLAVRAAAARRGLSTRALHDAALWSLPEALLAARVVHVLGHPEVYLAAPARVAQVWDGGFSFGAGLLIGAWALARHARRHGPPGGRFLDVAVPGLLVAQAFAALGRVIDVLTAVPAPLPPWDQPAASSADQSGALAGISLGGANLLVPPLATALWALGLLIIYAVLARRQPGPGFVFRGYLFLQAVGQIGVRLVGGGAAPDTLGVAAWAVVAVAAALSALYHLRSADRGVVSDG